MNSIIDLLIYYLLSIFVLIYSFPPGFTTQNYLLQTMLLLLPGLNSELLTSDSELQSSIHPTSVYYRFRIENNCAGSIVFFKINFLKFVVCHSQ